MLKKTAVKAYAPASLSAVFSLLKRDPEALLVTGGTYLLMPDNDRWNNPGSTVISLANVKELKRITRTDKNIEIGSAASFHKILRIGALLPDALRQALESISSIPVRNLASMGGNLCVSDYCLSLYALSHISEMHLELRRQGNSRWLPAFRFRDKDGKPALEKGEVLTRIRIPLDRWNVQHFRSYGTAYISETNPLHVCLLANIERDTISDFRFAASTHLSQIIRSKEIEAELVGRRLPLGPKELDVLFSLIDSMLTTHENIVRPFGRERIRRFLRSILRQLKPTS